jgi:hypothetical protein
MEKLIDVDKIVGSILYDVFAYRLSPDEWEEAEFDFWTRLKKEMDQIPISFPFNPSNLRLEKHG